MQMYNFDFMKNGSPEPIETVSNMMRTLDEAKTRCKNLLAGRGSLIDADSVRLRENGGPAVIFRWPADV